LFHDKAAKSMPEGVLHYENQTKGESRMSEENCRIYAVVNQKGGVGKSVTSTNLGIGLARHGQRVLIADLDSQASQTVSLGWKQPDELPVTIATQLGRVIENKSFDPQDGILSHARLPHLLF
jgi:cellulose biosynthesis protein BcsQ